MKIINNDLFYQGNSNSKNKNKKSVFIINGNKYTSNNLWDENVYLILDYKSQKDNAYNFSSNIKEEEYGC